MDEGDVERLREHLLVQRRKILSMMIERLDDYGVDVGFVSMVADMQMCLVALDEVDESRLRGS